MKPFIHSQPPSKGNVLFDVEAGKGSRIATPGPLKRRELICTLASYRSTGTLGMQLHHRIVTFIVPHACSLLLTRHMRRNGCQEVWGQGGVTLPLTSYWRML